MQHAGSWVPMQDAAHNPWLVRESDFPAQESASERLRFLLNYAVLAPSRFNTQPWLFKITGNDLRLYADRTRALPVSDPNDRALIVGCGCALYHLRIAIRHFGYKVLLHTFPDLNDEDLLAVVRLGPSHPSTPDIDRLFSAITSQAPDESAADSWAALPTLLDPEIARFGVDLHPSSESGELAALRAIVTLAMAEAAENADLVGERDNWRSTLDTTKNGRQESTEPDAAEPSILSNGYHTTRDADAGRLTERLLVISTPGDNTASWLAAGQALAYVILRTCASGRCAVPLHAPIEDPEHRTAIARITGISGHPQVLAQTVSGARRVAGPRRPVHDVLLTQR